MSAMASQINSLTIVYSSVYSGADQRKHQSSASLAFDRRIHRWPENSPHKGPVTRKMFRLDDVIMRSLCPRSSFWRWFLTYSIFSCEQAAPRRLLSVCPSVRPSVCLSVCPPVCCTFSTMFLPLYHHEVITNDRSDVHGKGQGQRSKVKVPEVKTPFSRFGTVTQVWVDIWWWNDAQSLMLFRIGALLFFKVFRQISRSHG